MMKKVAIKRVLCCLAISVIVLSVVPVSVCATQDQAQIHSFSHTSGTVAGSTGPTSEATSTTSLPYESILSDGYGHYMKFMLYGPEEVVKDEIETYVVRIESVDSDGNPIQRIIMRGNVYTCYKDDAVEIYPVSIKERWNERWYDIDPEQDWDEDSIMKAVCGDLMSLTIPIPGLGTLLALFTENPPKPAWAVFYDENTYDTLQIPFTPPTKWGSRYVPLVGEQPHPNAVELGIPYKFTSEGSHQIYFFMWAQGMAPSSPVSTSDYYITVEAPTSILELLPTPPPTPTPQAPVIGYIHESWQCNGAYGFINYVGGKGYKTTRLTVKPITSNYLEKNNVKVVVVSECIYNTWRFFTESELEELKTFVENGGALIISIQGGGEADIARYNELTKAFGIEITPVNYETTEVGVISSHQIFNDVSVINMHCTSKGAYISDLGGSDSILDYTLKDGKTVSIASELHYGNGYVLIFGAGATYHQDTDHYQLYHNILDRYLIK